VTNPVFLDVDGNGEYDAPNSTPGWAEGGKDLRSMSAPLMSARGASSPLEDETDYDTWRMQQLRYFQRLIVQAIEPGFIK
jgi:hypothetical protein